MATVTTALAAKFPGEGAPVDLVAGRQHDFIDHPEVLGQLVGGQALGGETAQIVE